MLYFKQLRARLHTWLHAREPRPRRPLSYREWELRQQDAAVRRLTRMAAAAGLATFGREGLGAGW